MWWTLLAAGVVCVAAQLADAAEEHVETVRKLLQQEANHLRGQQYRQDGSENIVGIRKNYSAKFSIALETDTQYAFAAVCDQDCGHVAVSLFDRDSALLVRSPEVQQAVIIAGKSPAPGTH